MPQLTTLLFDVDGTLADTERDGHRPAFNKAFQEAGLDWDWTVELYADLLTVTGVRSVFVTLSKNTCLILLRLKV